MDNHIEYSEFNDNSVQGSSLQDTVRNGDGAQEPSKCQETSEQRKADNRPNTQTFDGASSATKELTGDAENKIGTDGEETAKSQNGEISGQDTATVKEDELTPANDEIGTQILKAILENDSEFIRNMSSDWLIKRINYQDYEQLQLLFVAVWEKNLDIVKILCDRGTKLSEKRDSGVSVFHFGFLPPSSGSTADLERQLLEMIQYLIEAGGDVHYSDNTGLNIFHDAILTNVPESVFELLLESTSKDSKTTLLEQPMSTSKTTPLHLAIWEKRLDLVRILLKHGSNIEALDDDNWTPLAMAVYNNQVDIIDELLLEPSNDTTSANILATSQDQTSVMHLAASQGHKEACQKLLKAGCSVEPKNSYGETPLHMAASSGSDSVVQLLIEAGAHIEAETQSQDTALHYAARSGSAETVKLLISAGASINARNSHKAHPLLIGTYKNRLEICKILIEADSDVLFEDGDGDTIVHDPLANHWVDLVIYLLQEYNSVAYKRRLPSRPEGSDDEAVAKKLLDSLKSENEPEDYAKVRWLLLQWAILCGYPSIVDMCQVTRDDLLSQDNKDQATLLHLAASHEDSKVTNLIWNKYESSKCHVEAMLAKSKDGLTALALAIKRKHDTMCNLIWQTVTNMDFLDPHADDILEMAAFHDTIGQEKFLIKALSRRHLLVGAPVPPGELQVNYGTWTALHWAVYNGLVVVVWWLLAKGGHLSQKERSVAQKIVKKIQEHQKYRKSRETADPVFNTKLTQRSMTIDMFNSSVSINNMEHHEHTKPTLLSRSTFSAGTLDRQLTVITDPKLTTNSLKKGPGPRDEQRTKEEDVYHRIERLLINPPAVQGPDGFFDHSEFTDRPLASLNSQQHKVCTVVKATLVKFFKQSEKVNFNKLEQTPSTIYETLYGSGLEELEQLRDGDYKDLESLKHQVANKGTDKGRIPTDFKEKTGIVTASARERLKSGKREGQLTRRSADSPQATPKEESQHPWNHEDEKLGEKRSGKTDMNNKIEMNYPSANPAKRVAPTFQTDKTTKNIFTENHSQIIQTGQKPKQHLYRWVHIPANNMTWIEDFVTRLCNHKRKKNYEHRQIHDFMRRSWTALSNAELGSRHMMPRFVTESVRSFEGHLVPSEAVASSLKPIPDSQGRQQDPIHAQMPYINVSESHIQQSKQMTQTDSTMELIPNQAEINELLRIQYQNDLHVSRTLDQYYYSHLNTAEKDEDQVIQRYLKEKIEEENKSDVSLPILRVDQLWLWILDKDTIITSSTHRSDSGEDPIATVIFDELIERRRRDEDPPATAEDMMFMILSIVSRIVKVPRVQVQGEATMESVLQIFENSIHNVADKEQNLFKSFRDSLVSFDNSGNGLEEDNRFEDILHETDLLRETKDILDELGILTKLVLDQKTVCDKAFSTQKLQTDLYRSRQSSPDNMELASIEDELKIMTDTAKGVQASINSLLNLKQKQANISEARSARNQAQKASEQSELMLKQSQTMTAFTFVTIFFLPLSFLTSFFALNITIFPHAQGGDGPALPPKFIFPLLFGLSFIIIAPITIIALNSWNIRDRFSTAFKVFKRAPIPPRRDITTLQTQEKEESEPRIHSKFDFIRKRRTHTAVWPRSSGDSIGQYPDGQSVLPR